MKDIVLEKISYNYEHIQALLKHYHMKNELPYYFKQGQIDTT